MHKALFIYGVDFLCGGTIIQSMNKFEHYEPSEEEMKNAEDMMGPKKAELSALRERSAQLLKEKGMDGYLELSQMEGKNVVSGRINGHSIVLKIDTAGEGGRSWQGEWQGEVDGFKLQPEENEKFVEKYRDVWASLQSQDIEVAQKEELAPGRAEVLKDIGL